MELVRFEIFAWVRGQHWKVGEVDAASVRHAFELAHRLEEWPQVPSGAPLMIVEKVLEGAA